MSIVPGAGCVLNSSSRAVCWGLIPEGSEPAVDLLDVVAGGLEWACGITASDRSLVCWGNGPWSDPSWLAAQEVIPQVRWAEISNTSSDGPLCLRSESGDVHCYVFSETEILSWGEIPGAGWHEMGAGGWQVCAARPDGSNACWTPYDDEFSEFSFPKFKVSQIVASTYWFTACAIGDPGGVAVCKHFDGDGAEPPLARYQDIALGFGDEGCGVTIHGGMHCWGDAIWGETDPPE